MRVFPREQIFVVRLEDYRQNRSETARRIFRFLNLRKKWLVGTYVYIYYQAGLCHKTVLLGHSRWSVQIYLTLLPYTEINPLTITYEFHAVIINNGIFLTMQAIYNILILDWGLDVLYDTLSFLWAAITHSHPNFDVGSVAPLKKFGHPKCIRI